MLTQRYAIGSNTQSTGFDSIVLGGLLGTSTKSVANGVDSLVLGLGASSTSAATGGVAIGTGSVVDRANSVSVGASGAERQIINVAAATQGTDAVNLNQLNAAIAGVSGGGGGGAYVPLAGGTMTGTLNMGGNSVTGLKNGSVAAGSTDAVTGDQLNTTNLAVTAAQTTADGALQRSGGTMSGALNLGGNGLTGLQNGAVAAGSTDAVTGDQLNTTNLTVTDVEMTADGALQRSGGTMSGALNLGGNALTGLENGTVAAGSTDAVTGGQLYTIEQTIGSGGGTPYLAVGGMGATPIVSGTGAVGIGVGQTANGDGAVAIGDPNTATGTGAVAIGANNMATGNGAVALGNSNVAGGQGAVALGNTSTANAAGSLAMGDTATVAAAATNGVALGSGSSATAANAVAIGAGSVASQANTVSVGAAGAERKVVNVAQGNVAAGSTDAVNGGQVYSVAQSVAANLGGGATVKADGTVSAPSYTVQGSSYNNVGAAISALDSNMSSLQSQINTVNNSVDQLRREERFGVAAAMAATAPSLPSAPGRTSWAVNVAQFHGARATAMALAHRLNTTVPFAFTAGVAFTQDTSAIRVGLAGEF
jgi:autotransporter adhesin